MSRDPVHDYLLDRIHGLQGVVVSLSTLLINKGVIDEADLLTNLEQHSELLAQGPDQAEVFQSVKRTLAGEGVWIPRLIDGGKSGSHNPEDDPDGG